MSEITFKYNFGDMVTLVKLPPYEQQAHFHRNPEFEPKQYKIVGYRYVVKNDRTTAIEYRLYAYCDEYLDYHNWITDDCIGGETHPHTKTVEFVSADGSALNIGDEVYTSIYYGDSNNRAEAYVSPEFSFTRKIKIEQLVYECEGSGRINSLTVKYYRGGEVYPEYKENIHEEYVGLAVKNITEQVIVDYVKAAKERKENPANTKIHNHEHIKKWLTHLGIYEEACKLYAKRPSSSKKKETAKTKKGATVKDMLAKMTEEQKGEMLRLLTEK